MLDYGRGDAAVWRAGAAVFGAPHALRFASHKRAQGELVSIHFRDITSNRFASSRISPIFRLRMKLNSALITGSFHFPANT